MARRDLHSVLGYEAPAAGGALAPLGDLEEAIRTGLARLRRVALRITRDAAAAEDVVQNAVEKALRAQARFRGEAKASTWLHRIVVNEALMWYRGQARRAAHRDALGEWLACGAHEPPDDPLAVLLVAEQRHEVRRALGSLRLDDADLLLHCADGEGDYASWAGRRGLAPSAAKTRAFRARRALRRALEAAQA